MREAVAQRRAERDAEMAKLTEPQRLFENLVGTRYASCTFDGYDTTDKDPEVARAKREVLQACRNLTDRIETVVEQGRSVVWTGPVGTGKDHLLACVLREAMQRKVTTGFVTGPNLAAATRDLIDRNTSEQEFLGRWANLKLLAISEPDGTKEKQSDFYAEWLFRIVDGRYREKRSVFITINATSDKKIGEMVGLRTWDRIRDGALILRMDWGTKRRAAKVVGTAKRQESRP